MTNQKDDSRARLVIERFTEAGLTVATAESCTGGLIAGALTDIAGSSAVVDRGFVTYSNEAKSEMLGVPENLIAEHGAVSEPVARKMAEGALEKAGVDRTVAVTGIAGPGGGSKQKPVGLVHFAVAILGEETRHEEIVFPEANRDSVRKQTVAHALRLLLETIHN
ncbi:MAG: CinA family protein [Pseudomonadota bacterium]